MDGSSIRPGPLKRSLLAFAIVVAAAASLGGITSSDMGADDKVVASCDTDGVTSSYTTEYASAVPASGWTRSPVGGLNDACDGDSMTGLTVMCVMLAGPARRDPA